MTNIKKPSKKSRPVKERIEVTESCGNIFADLGLPNPELALAKADLILQIRDLIAERKLSHGYASKLLKVDPVKLTALLRGQTPGFSLDRLFKFLNLLGQQVAIRVAPLSENSPGLAVSRGAG